MDATTARDTLHRWIDKADDTLVIGLVEIATQLQQVIRQQVEQKLMNHGYLPETAEDRRERADRLAQEGMLKRMSRPRPPLPPADNNDEA